MTYPNAPAWSQNDDLTNTAQVIIDHVQTDEFKANQSMNFETQFPCTLLANTIKELMYQQNVNDFAVMALVNTETCVWIKYQPDVI